MNPLDFSRIKDEAHPEDFLSEMKPLWGFDDVLPVCHDGSGNKV